MPVTLAKQVGTTKPVYLGDHPFQHAAMMVPMRLSSKSQASVRGSPRISFHELGHDMTSTQVQSVQW